MLSSFPDEKDAIATEPPEGRAKHDHAPRGVTRVRVKRVRTSTSARHGTTTVAALHGNVVGAGLGLALACDFRVVADSAKLAAGFLKVGYSGDFGGTYFLSRIVGTDRLPLVPAMT